jgi:hypothetical protein
MVSNIAAAADSDSRQIIERLVEAADAAMYEAKRGGDSPERLPGGVTMTDLHRFC